MRARSSFSFSAFFVLFSSIGSAFVAELDPSDEALRNAEPSAQVASPTVPSASIDSGGSLWDPVPRDRMRPLTTDRPDLTESPISVDAGHVQAELDLVVATFRDSRSERVQFDVLPTNLKLG
jgi:hypothetical protein